MTIKRMSAQKLCEYFVKECFTRRYKSKLKDIQTAKSNSMTVSYSYGYVDLLSFDTPICRYYKGKFYVDMFKYSVRTSQHQCYLLRELYKNDTINSGRIVYVYKGNNGICKYFIEKIFK